MNCQTICSHTCNHSPGYATIILHEWPNFAWPDTAWQRTSNQVNASPIEAITLVSCMWSMAWLYVWYLCMYMWKFVCTHDVSKVTLYTPTVYCGMMPHCASMSVPAAHGSNATQKNRLACVFIKRTSITLGFNHCYILTIINVSINMLVVYDEVSQKVTCITFVHALYIHVDNL